MTTDAYTFGRSSWEMTISETEVDQLASIFSRFTFDPDHDVVWLRVKPNGDRWWSFEIDSHIVWLTSTGTPPPRELIVPLSGIFLYSIARGLLDLDECTLSYNAIDNTLVARIGNLTILSDYSRTSEVPVALLNDELEDFDLSTDFCALINYDDFYRFIGMQSVMPNSANLAEAAIAPYLTINIASGLFRGTTDWRRFGGSCITTAIPVRATDDITFACIGGMWGRLFSTVEDQDDVEIRINSYNMDYVYISCGNIHCRFEVQHEHVKRWILIIYAALIECGATPHLEIRPNMGESFGFEYQETEMTATIITRDADDHDRVRLSLRLAGVAGDNEQTFREVNAMNESLVDVKLLLQNNAVFAVIDVHPTDTEKIGHALDVLAEIQERFVGIEALFASYA
jgi:hypothetical protein